MGVGQRRGEARRTGGVDGEVWRGRARVRGTGDGLDWVEEARRGEEATGGFGGRRLVSAAAGGGRLVSPTAEVDVWRAGRRGGGSVVARHGRGAGWVAPGAAIRGVVWARQDGGSTSRRTAAENEAGFGATSRGRLRRQHGGGSDIV